jgi:tRNA (guanine37-N1)-methyltransferase
MPEALELPGFPGLRIARAVAADAPELLVLQRACWVQEAIENDRLDIPSLHESLDDVVRGIAEQQTWVVRDGARPVATVRGKPVGDAWEVGRLGVVPDLAGRGLGRFLLGWVEEHAPDDIRGFQLFTGALSARNLRMYGRAGYVLQRTHDGVAHLTKPRGE